MISAHLNKKGLLPDRGAANTFSPEENTSLWRKITLSSETGPRVIIGIIQESKC